MPKLTKQTVDAVKPDPSGRDVFVWDSGDGALKGFGLRVKPSGVASFIVQYRNTEGRTRRLAIGRVGTLTPADARELAGDKLREATKGGDPSAERHSARKAITVAEYCDQYLEDAEAGRIVGRSGKPIKISTLAMDRSRIETHVKPLIGRRTVAGLVLKDIAKMQSDIAAGKTKRARPKKGRTGDTRGGRGAAARTVGMLATMLERARRDGLMDANPARGVQRYADVPRKRYLTTDDITALGKAIKQAVTDGRGRTGLAAVRALLLTGCRKSEILSLPWTWFDAENRCIRFEDTKSGPQIRPLGLAAVEFLKQLPHDGEWMFPADKGGGHFVGVGPIIADLSKAAELERIIPHALRHTFASVAAELGFSELTISGLLGHSARGVTQRYSHVPDSALLAAADRVSARIAAALDGRQGDAVGSPGVASS